MDQRGRGRTRGRARPQEPYQQRPGPSHGSSQHRPGPSQGPSQPIPPSAWGPRPQSQMRGPAPPVQAMQAGRASYRSGGGGDIPMETSAVVQGQGSGAGDTGFHGGRGALRGGRVLMTDTILTKPASCNSKKGTTGTPVKLSANYFKLIQRTDWCLYQYRVDFAPEEDRTKVRKALFFRAIKDLMGKTGGVIFDGTVMYTPIKLPQDPTELFVDSESEGEKIRITIRLVGDVTPLDYHYLQVFNIIIRKCMSYLKLQLVQRNYFDAKAKIPMPQHHIELWPGYVTSIRQHEKDILMCCEITSKVMRNDTVLHLMAECSGDDQVNFKKLFAERIIGTIVLTDYNNRTYRIDDIDFNTTPNSKFGKSDGSSISYIQYYKDKYKINITNTTQPMLVSRAKPREIRAGMSELVYLVPELCRLTGLTEAQRANFRFMQEFAQHTRVGPSARIEKLRKFSQRLLEKPEVVQELKNWDLQLSKDIVHFAGRILPIEKIYGGNKVVYSAGSNVDWTRDVRGTPQLHALALQNWVIMSIGRCKQQAQKFVGMIQRAAGGMRWNVSEPRFYEIRDDRPGTYMLELENVIKQANPSLILCVVSNNKQDRYASIKKKCCVDRAVPTQVIQAKNLDAKGSMSIATKVAIQMNCKLGGAPWYVQVPIEGLMVVGYDACHDPRQKNKSYGAVVATINKTLSHYFGTFTHHTSGEELSNNFALELLKSLQVYKETTGAYPRKIIIYRDAVGEGQIPYVKEYELQHILKVLQEKIYGDKPVELAFIIVTKRINTRIFAENGNPQPGTVVDDVITMPERYDFMIVSQCVRQGTVSPTSYNVIYDTTGMAPDHMQRLTYKLTHMYYNWSGTVRVPAPCQYAHKLAFLASQYLQRTAHPQLDRVLYYL